MVKIEPTKLKEFEMKIVKKEGSFKIETKYNNGNTISKWEIPEFTERKLGRLIIAKDNRGKILRYIRRAL